MSVVDLSFPVVGASVPRDHGYALYSALSRALPEIHGARWLGVHPLSGMPADEALLLRRAQLRLRIPAERIATVLPLAGATLEVGESSLTLGAPSIHPLATAASLDARLVLFNLTRPPRRATPIGRETLDNDGLARRYQQQIARELERMGVRGTAELRGRRSLTIRGARQIGYSVRVSGLDADSSLRLLEAGLGGRRAMGCGIFRPTRGST
jgi:CRISPR-associated protein Cas6